MSKDFLEEIPLTKVSADELADRAKDILTQHIQTLRFWLLSIHKKDGEDVDESAMRECSQVVKDRFQDGSLRIGVPPQLSKEFIEIQTIISELIPKLQSDSNAAMFLVRIYICIADAQIEVNSIMRDKRIGQVFPLLYIATRAAIFSTIDDIRKKITAVIFEFTEKAENQGAMPRLHSCQGDQHALRMLVVLCEKQADGAFEALEMLARYKFPRAINAFQTLSQKRIDGSMEVRQR